MKNSFRYSNASIVSICEICHNPIGSDYFVYHDVKGMVHKSCYCAIYVDNEDYARIVVEKGNMTMGEILAKRMELL